MKPWQHGGQTYYWYKGGWTLNGVPLALPHQIKLARAYLAELRTRASSLGPDEMVRECTVLRDLARTDPKILESALDFCSHVLRLNPGHRGARALHMSILMKLEQFEPRWGTSKWTN